MANKKKIHVLKKKNHILLNLKLYTDSDLRLNEEKNAFLTQHSLPTVLHKLSGLADPCPLWLCSPQAERATHHPPKLCQETARRERLMCLRPYVYLGILSPQESLITQGFQTQLKCGPLPRHP